MSPSVADDVEERVLAVTIEVLSLDGGKPALSARIVEDLGADSIDQFSLVSALECEFGGTIDEDTMERLHTLEDVISCIRVARRVQP